jgi:hypothetical protein
MRNGSTDFSSARRASAAARRGALRGVFARGGGVSPCGGFAIDDSGDSLRGGSSGTRARRSGAAIRCVVSVGLLSLAACSSDATLYVEQRPDSPQQGTPSGTDTPGSPSVLGAGGDPGSPLGGAPGDSPVPVLPSPSQEPEPNATETNFFAAGCRVDEDCGATRRCEFPPPESVALDAGRADAGSDGGLFDTRPVGPPPVPPDAGPPPGTDAGAAPDAAPDGPPTPRGRCVARVDNTP